MPAKYLPIPGTDDLMLDAVTALLGASSDQDMTPPFFIFSIASNGSVFVVRATDDGDGGLEMETLAEHDVDGVAQLPIMIGAVDPGTGKSILRRINADGLSRIMN